MEQQVQSVPNDRTIRKTIFVVNLILLILLLTIVVYPIVFFTPPHDKLDGFSQSSFYKGFENVVESMIYKPFHINLNSFGGLKESFATFLAFYLWYISVIFLFALVHLTVITLFNVMSSNKKNKLAKIAAEIILIAFNLFQLTMFICYCFIKPVESNASFVYNFFHYFASLFDEEGLLRQFNFLNNPYLTSVFYMLVIQLLLNLVVNLVNLITIRRKVSSYGLLAREVKKGGNRPIMQEKQDYQIIPTGLFTKKNEKALKKANFLRSKSFKKSTDSLKSKTKKKNKTDLDEKIVPTNIETHILDSLEPINLDSLGSKVSNKTDLDSLISENELSKIENEDLRTMDDKDLKNALNSLEPYSLDEADVEDELLKETSVNKNNDFVKPSEIKDEVKEDVYENTLKPTEDEIKENKKIELAREKAFERHDKEIKKQAKEEAKKQAKNDSFAKKLALSSIENNNKVERKAALETERLVKKAEKSKPVEEKKVEAVTNEPIKLEEIENQQVNVSTDELLTNEKLDEETANENVEKIETVVEDKKSKKNKKKDKKKKKSQVEEVQPVENVETPIEDKKEEKAEEVKKPKNKTISSRAIQPNDDYDTTMTTFTREELAKGNFGFASTPVSNRSLPEDVSFDDVQPSEQDDAIPSGFEGDDNIIFENNDQMYPETGVGNAKVLFESVPEYNCSTEQTTLYKRWQDKFVRFFDIVYIVIFTLLAVIAVLLFTPLKDYYFNDLMQYSFVRQIIDMVPTRFYAPFNIEGMPLQFWGQTSDFMAIVTLYTVAVGTALMLLQVHLCFSNINKCKRHGKRGMWLRTFLEFILILANLFVLGCFYLLCFRNELYEQPIIRMLYDLFDQVANYISLDSPIDILRNFNFNLNPKVMLLVYSLVALIIVNLILHLFFYVGRSHPLAIKWKKEYKRISTGSGKVVRHIVGRGRGYYGGGYGGYGIAAAFTKKYGDGDPTHVEFSNFNEQDIVKNVILVKYRPIADIIATLFNDVPERLTPDLTVYNTEKSEISEEALETITLNNLDREEVKTQEYSQNDDWILPAYDRNADRVKYNTIKVHDAYVSYTLSYGEGESESIIGLNRARLIYKSLDSRIDQPYDEILSPWEDLYHDDTQLPLVTSRAVEIFDSLEQGFKVDDIVEDPEFEQRRLKELYKEITARRYVSNKDTSRAYKIYLSLDYSEIRNEVYSPFVITSKYIGDVIETEEMKQYQRIGQLFTVNAGLDRALQIYESLDVVPVKNWNIRSPFISNDELKEEFYKEQVTYNELVEVKEIATYDDRAIEIYHSLDIDYIESLDVLVYHDKDRSLSIYDSLDNRIEETLEISDEIKQIEAVPARVLEIYYSLEEDLIPCKLLEIDSHVVDPFEHLDDSIVLPDPWPALTRTSESIVNNVEEKVEEVKDDSTFDYYEVVAPITQLVIEETKVVEQSKVEDVKDDGKLEYYEVVASEPDKLEEERKDEERVEEKEELVEPTFIPSENNEYNEFEAYEVVNEELSSTPLEESNPTYESIVEEVKDDSIFDYYEVVAPITEPVIDETKVVEQPHVEEVEDDSIFDYYEVVAPIAEIIAESPKVVEEIPASEPVEEKKLPIFTLGGNYEDYEIDDRVEEKLEDERLEEERVEVKEKEKPEENKPVISSKPKGPIKIKPVAPIKHEEVVEEIPEEKVLEKISKPLHAISATAKPEIKPVEPKHVPFNLKEFMIDKYDGYLTPEEAFIRGIAKVRSVVAPVVNNRSNDSSWKQKKLEDSYRKNDYANLSSVNDLDKYRNVEKGSNANLSKSTSIRDLKKALEEEKLKKEKQNEKESTFDKPIKPISPIKPIEPKKENKEDEVIDKKVEDEKKDLAPISIKHRLNTKPKPVIKPVDPSKKK